MIDIYRREGVLVLRVSSNNGFEASVENVASWYKTARDYTLENWGN